MGGREPVVSDKTILSVFIQSDDPILSAPEVSESISIGEQGTYQRLRELEEKGLVGSKKIGRGRAWWITGAGREEVD